MNGLQEDLQETGEKLTKVLFFTLIISVMNASMFNIVLPTISKEFSLTPSLISWMSTGYMIVYAIGTVTYGKLADKFKLKDLLTFGLLFMTLGSVIGLLSTEYWMIILGRVLQATGASVIPAVAMIIPVRYFSPQHRGRALGTIASGLAFGTAIGPIVAGFVTSMVGWRFLFIVSLLVLFTLPYYRKYLKDDVVKEGKMDYLGGILLSGTIAALLLAITRSDWLLLGVGVFSLVVFIIRIRLANQPFIQPKLFSNNLYVFGLGITVIGTAIAFSTPFLAPQMLANVNHLSPAMIGLIMFPGAMLSAFLGKTGGKLADQKGSPYLFYLASLLIILAFSLLSFVAGLSPYLILVFLVLANLGQTFTQIAMSNTISRTLPKEQAGIGMGLFQMFNFIAGATSTTILGKVLDLGSTSLQLNPLAISKQGLIYSNIFVVLTVLLLVNVWLYYRLFSKSEVARKAVAVESSI